MSHLIKTGQSVERALEVAQILGQQGKPSRVPITPLEDQPKSHGSDLERDAQQMAPVLQFINDLEDTWCFMVQLPVVPDFVPVDR